MTKSENIQTPPYFLGIDNGLSVIKAVIFTLDGKEVDSGIVEGKNNSPHPKWVERDMNNVWNWACKAIKKVLYSSNVSPEKIKAIGVTAHGDGLYLINKNGNPVREGIVSLDTRAVDILNKWKNASVFTESLRLSGQFPFEGSPAPLLSWIKKNEPYIYEKIGWVLTCKDWIRFKLSGEVFTDFTEASSSFTNVITQEYDTDIFKLFNLEEMFDKMAPVKFPMTIAGHVSKKASEETGLKEGTPIGTGLHDVDACSVGSGCIHSGHALSIMGTWSINQVVTDQPSSNPSLMCRNYINPGSWVNLACSPASTTNLDWFVQNLCKYEYDEEKKMGKSGFDFVNKEIEKVVNSNSEVFFLPFLYGSPFGGNSSSCFLGIKGWHKRAHLLKAIFEGVVFNHKYHIDDMQKETEINEIRLTGGGQRSVVWSQMFADAVNLPILIPNSNETGALGAVICACVASGYYNSVDEAVNNIVSIKQEYLPNKIQNERLSESYKHYKNFCALLRNNWDK
jgi:L-xylulokinase